MYMKPDGKQTARNRDDHRNSGLRRKRYGSSRATDRASPPADAVFRQGSIEERAIPDRQRRNTWRALERFQGLCEAAGCGPLCEDESAHCLACEEGRLRIGFAKGYLFRDDVDAGKTALETLARQFFRQETALEIETLAPETACPVQNNNNGNGPNGRAAKNHRLQEIRREALSHPLVLKFSMCSPVRRCGR